VRNLDRFSVGDRVLLDRDSPWSRSHRVAGRIVGTAWLTDTQGHRFSYVVEVAGGQDGFTSSTCLRLFELERLSKRNRDDVNREPPVDWFELEEDKS
jgi:hypothetical protein